MNPKNYDPVRIAAPSNGYVYTCMQQFEMMLLLCCGYHDYANRTVNQSYNVVSVVGGYVSGQMSGNTNDLMHHSLDEAFLKGVGICWDGGWR